MAKLGSPQTTKFSIGTAELRVGVLEKALKLVQGNSVGLIDNATVEVTQESVDLNGGFPKVLVDTAVVSQEATITAGLKGVHGVGTRGDRLRLDLGGLRGPQDQLARDDAFDVGLEGDLVDQS